MASSSFDEIDSRLMDILQREFPLVSRPFDAIAARVGIAPAEVMDRISRLKSERVIRQISAIFDSSALGYSGALVAFKVRPELMDRVAEGVSAHAGVSHCYSRDADFNLWFTMTLPPEGDLTSQVQALASVVGVEAHVILPALRVFKIGVFFDVGGEDLNRESPKGDFTTQRCVHEPLGEDDRAAVRALQKDLPIVDAPFAELARGVGMIEDELLTRAAQFAADGVMRRFAAVLRHQRAGYRANAMVCWRVDPDKIDAAGAIFASHPSVSHCYERSVSAEWPYPLYTMIHARDEQELERTIAELAASSGLSDYRVLRSIREYKKSRVVYFE